MTMSPEERAAMRAITTTEEMLACGEEIRARFKQDAGLEDSEEMHFALRQMWAAGRDWGYACSVDEYERQVAQITAEWDAAMAEVAWERHRGDCGQCGSHGTRPLCPSGNRLHTAVMDAYAATAPETAAGESDVDL